MRAILPLPSTVNVWHERTSVTDEPAGNSVPVNVKDFGDAEEPMLLATETTWRPSLPLRMAMV